jgi:hypothetical protein
MAAWWQTGQAQLSERALTPIGAAIVNPAR